MVFTFIKFSSCDLRLVNAEWHDPDDNAPEAGNGRVPHVGHLIDGQVDELT
jgi:hypothetical protein